MTDLKALKANRESSRATTAKKANERKTTYANSNMLRADKITQTAMIDYCVALAIADSKHNLVIAEQLSVLVSEHFNAVIAAKRIDKHLSDNIFEKKLAFFTANFSQQAVCTNCASVKCSDKCKKELKAKKEQRDDIQLIVASPDFVKNAECYAESFNTTLEQDSFVKHRLTL